MNTTAICKAVRSQGKRRGGPNTDIYSSQFRHDIDNDSSTDEELSDDEGSSSDEDDDFKSRFGQIATQTSQQGKVRISRSKRAEEGETRHEGDGEAMELENNGGDEEEDEFEADMKRELEARVYQAEKDASIANLDCPPVTEGEVGEGEAGTSGTASGAVPSSGGGEGDGQQGEKYDDIYFDSDEEDGENRKMKTNDELFYDPNMDDEDQDWVDDVRRSYQVTSNKKNKDGTIKPLPNSDAVLNCPACFTVVCLDCQRHELYKTQYRAMFVLNCSVLTDQKMRVPIKLKGRNKKNKAVTNPNDEFHPVRCDQCQTEIAMYDQDEIYHFFNVVASHT